MTEPGAGRVDPEGRGELEEEREFLLRSLDDLDSELLAGNIDPDTYRVLHDDYTARASAVIQSLADGVDRHSPDSPRVPPLVRVLTIGGIVVFAVLAAILLTYAIGQRRPGQTITGNAQVGAQASGSPTTAGSQASSLASAKATAVADPKSYSAQINYARALMATGALPLAIQQFIVASKVDPTQPEPLAYSGYLTTLVVEQMTDAGQRQALITAATRSLQQAIDADPAYPDSYAFRGVLLAQVENKPCPGAVAFEQFLVKAPSDHPLRSQVQTAVATAIKAGNCPEPKSTPTTNP